MSAKDAAVTKTNKNAMSAAPDCFLIVRFEKTFTILIPSCQRKLASNRYQKPLDSSLPWNDK
ncbi:MAG: hypothetical protein M3436_09170 [Pseudomonadota bacterium]|nr:hypothetical protein [Pseudomonadota bacterium]